MPTGKLLPPEKYVQRNQESNEQYRHENKITGAALVSLNYFMQ